MHQPITPIIPSGSPSFALAGRDEVPAQSPTNIVETVLGTSSSCSRSVSTRPPADEGLGAFRKVDPFMVVKDDVLLNRALQQPDSCS
jgi:hypothetical protein